MSELIHPAKDWHRHCVIFVQQVVFLTVNHRGPLPLRELHSTDEILVWRDPGGSWACLQSVPNYKWINSPCQRLWHRHNASFFLFFPFFQQVVFLTVNHHGPLPFRELHSTDETIVWRDPGGSWACLRPVYSYEWINSPSQRLRHRHSVVFVQQVVFLTVNHRGHLPLRELHSTDEALAWRDPGGSWACLQPVPNYKWINSPCQRLWHRHNASSSFFFFSFFSAGRFSYSESPQTPPLEGTSLHRWNISVERPWGILSLFTTCLQLRVN